MEKIQVLEHGQVVLPEGIRRAHHWDVGQELLVVDSGEGVLLTSKVLFEPTTLDEVAGCLHYTGRAKTLDEMQQAIAEGVKQTYANRT
jgi:bifunctional DNA-binding transcriptional regulator/antitoxin component of YhaV-PrlF toxin-antitoxin module